MILGCMSDSSLGFLHRFHQAVWSCHQRHPLPPTFPDHAALLWGMSTFLHSVLGVSVFKNEILRDFVQPSVA
jgi:hypothetical protein